MASSRDDIRRHRETYNLSAFTKQDNTNPSLLVFLWCLTIFLACIAYTYFSSPWSFWSISCLTIFIPFFIGILQHNLAALGHEATHYTLINSPRWEDTISDWLCMFPLFTSTAIYRKQHLDHHRYVNHTTRDPDIYQLRASGHWNVFPCEPFQYIIFLGKQIWPTNPMRYIFGRNLLERRLIPKKRNHLNGFTLLNRYRYAVLGTLLLCPLFLKTFPSFTLSILTFFTPAVITCVTIHVASRLSSQHLVLGEFPSKQKTDDSSKKLLKQRIFHTFILFQVVMTFSLYDIYFSWFFLLFWVFPLITTFPFFMILRQISQHGNRDRGFYSNTHNFWVKPWVRWCIFPFGQDLHLIHHMYPSIPHYQLRQVHKFLWEKDLSYKIRSSQLDGYFLSKKKRSALLALSLNHEIEK